MNADEREFESKSRITSKAIRNGFVFICVYSRSSAAIVFIQITRTSNFNFSTSFAADVFASPSKICACLVL